MAEIHPSLMWHVAVVPGQPVKSGVLSLECWVSKPCIDFPCILAPNLHMHHIYCTSFFLRTACQSLKPCMLKHLQKTWSSTISDLGGSTPLVALHQYWPLSSRDTLGKVKLPSIVRFSSVVPLGAIHATWGVGLPSTVQTRTTWLPSRTGRGNTSVLIFSGGSAKKNKKYTKTSVTSLFVLFLWPW